jgi:hypothetical protein
MTITEWAGLAVALTTIVASFVGSVRWLVKHYLSELKINGGSSVKDQVNRLETRVDQIYILLSEGKE